MKNKGFTLIELMITITIMLIMTATVLFSYNKFNESSLLSAFAYDMSLTIRQAQVYGSAVREGGATSQSSGVTIDNANFSTSPFLSSYGVHFDKNAAPPSTFPFVLFADNDGSGSLNSGDTVLQSFTFQRGIVIGGLCADTNNNGVCTEVSNLDIIFTRPNPEAMIYVNGSDAVGPAQIRLQNANNDIYKTITVESTGQISVQ